MIKLVTKGSILIGILFAITVVMNSIDPLPYTWGSIQLNTKIQFLKDKKITPKAYFIGSSNTLRQVIPNLFNKLVERDSTYAFNLGVDGALPPKTFHILENLIQEQPNIEYIFLEVNGFEYLPEHYFIPTRRKYYYKLPELWKSYRYIWSGSSSLKVKLGMTIKYLIAYAENAFKIGMRTDFIKFIHGENVFDYSFVGKNGDGYYPLEGMHTTTERMKKRLPTYLQNLNNDFTKVYQHLETIDNVVYNDYLRTLLLEQLALAKSRGVEIIFLLNPIKPEFHEVADIVALFYSLPASNRIDLANPINYPEFYQLENRWDEGHLNDAGAKIYTRKLAAAFRERLEATR